MRTKYIIGGLIIIGFTVWAAVSFNSSLTPYVSIDEAKHMQSVVQVKGERLDEGRYDMQKNLFVFHIKDENGVSVKVVYDGVKPGNFDQASHVVCVGKYENGAFHAKQLLVKCPSKYQEQETKV